MGIWRVFDFAVPLAQVYGFLPNLYELAVKIQETKGAIDAIFDSYAMRIISNLPWYGHSESFLRADFHCTYIPLENVRSD